MNTPYFKLNQSPDDPIEIMYELDLPEAEDGSIFHCTTGNAINVPVPPMFEIEIECGEDEVPRHFIEGKGVVVISAKFLKALKEAGVDNFEVFPAILKDPETDRIWKNYYVFNEVGVVDAALLEACEYDTIMGGDEETPPVLGFHKIVLSQEKVNQKPMFRIPQFRGHLFISEYVTKYLQKTVPPEKWGVLLKKVEVQ